MKNICWQITLVATSLTRHPPPFHEEKNSPKLKDCEIFYVIRVLGYSKFQKEKKLYFLIFFTCILEIVSAYHTGSAFTQQY